MKTFGKYQLLEELGNGPAGTTYRARETFRDSELALKVLRSATMDPVVKKQFCCQLAACSELQHSHIVKVHDLGEVDGEIYVATELLTGVDLHRWRQEGASLPITQRLKLIAQICDGLAFAHRNQIAHGNIKPSNIFITEDMEAKILDFGVARWPASIEHSDSRPARLPNYLAPEQILDRPFDSRSDLFSVGVLLYELIAGVYPFQSPAGLIPRQIVHAEPEPLRKLDAQIPEGLERLLVRALDKDPERRLQSADEFAVILHAIVRQLQPEQAVPAVVPPVGVLAGNLETPRPLNTTVEPLYVSTAVAAGANGRATASAPSVPQSPLVASAPPPNLANFTEAESEPASTPVVSSKRPLVFLAAALLGICILGALLSRQITKASPARVQSQVSQSASTLPDAKQPDAKQNEPSHPALEVQQIQPAAATPEPHPQPRPEQILNGPVASLWEAGRYVQAMRLVDAILADEPSQAEARAWKIRIRAAQDAEAGIK